MGENIAAGSQEQREEVNKYGTLTGVFIPTILTILGVIMFLRLGWVVGHAGLLGAWSIILLAVLITGLTTLSMSSMTTNIRIGAGGAFSIISQSLGLEVGGSIGLPLYLAQAMAAAMYIFGFREGWRWIFPQHPGLVVDLVVFALLFGVAFLSTKLALRIQSFIVVIIFGALISVGAAAFLDPMSFDIQWWGDFGRTAKGVSNLGYWGVFAVFFPAVTGIMAGANMSGELADPRRSIPVGTLSAIGLSTVIYLGLAYWLSRVASTQELISNFTIMIDRAAFGPVVLAGLLGATFSSALISLVGAPRILLALGQHGILPKSDWLSGSEEGGEPQNAMYVTGFIVLSVLMLRELNVLASVLTMFFLITYFMLNLVVFIEQSLSLVSFRPLLRVPQWVPALGALGCLFAMFIINPVFALVASGVVLVFYGLLVRRQLKAPFGDVRSGLFVALAEWAAGKVMTDLPGYPERTWKPNLLVPIEDIRNLRGTFRFIHDLTYPRGSVKVLSLAEYDSQRTFLKEEIEGFVQEFLDEGVLASSAFLEVDSLDKGLVSAMQAFAGTFLRPNILFVTQSRSREKEEAYRNLLHRAREADLGVLLFARHPLSGLGRQMMINVWIDDRSPDWDLSMDIGNLDLALLAAYKLLRNWDARLRLNTVVRDEQYAEAAHDFLVQLKEASRLPKTELNVVVDEFDRYIEEAPQADLNIFGLQETEELDFDFFRRMVEVMGSSCVFARDSGEENILA